MHCTHIPYEQTGFFSKIVIDYINQEDKLKPFYEHPVSLEGIKASIKARRAFPTNRQLLVTELEKQYAGLPLSKKQQQNIQSLLSENTFTITTAHQPNIFTGPLYFIYKIIHAIKMADELKTQLPEYSFVPVYYMGSEDADLDELGFIHLNGEKLVWETNQTGAVGRMKVDKNLLKLIDAIHGQIGVNPYGNELTSLFRKCYTEGKTIQQATLEMVNELFEDFGLLIVIPDNVELKRSFVPVIQKEIEEEFSHLAVDKTISGLKENYKVQAAGRDLNLFYLIDNNRERIELESINYVIPSLNIRWNKPEILEELAKNPERFSANVILRGVFQETILPNIAFIGGGGELAYWLELKNVFEKAGVPYPILVLRNSFLVVNEHAKLLIDKLKIASTDIFKTNFYLINQLVKKESQQQLSLSNEMAELEIFYKKLGSLAQKVDATLIGHTEALKARALKLVSSLEKKMLRAEKRKFQEMQLQVDHLKSMLFPSGNLQERTENFSIFHSQQGREWLQSIYRMSPSLEQRFTLAEIN
jgi:bacillithiol biosynthesis cysteine-adding enzyme BshC